MKKIPFKIKNTQDTRGFTIIETLVAISILLISTTGPLSFAQNGLKASFLARDQVTAFYLAQDAIETIKNLRDNTQLEIAAGIKSADTGWLRGLGDCESNSSTDIAVCNFDKAGTSIETTTCNPSTGCSPLQYDAESRQFVLPPGGTDSKYTRTIYVTEIKSDQEAQIIVEVKWDSSFLTGKRIIVQENIYKKY